MCKIVVRPILIVIAGDVPPLSYGLGAGGGRQLKTVRHPNGCHETKSLAKGPTDLGRYGVDPKFSSLTL
jgi:hypothetical protein